VKAPAQTSKNMIADKIEHLEREINRDKERSAIIDQMIALMKQGRANSREYASAKMRLNFLNGHTSNTTGGCKIIAMSF
jgi:hypothetical protein